MFNVFLHQVLLPGPELQALEVLEQGLDRYRTNGTEKEVTYSRIT